MSKINRSVWVHPKTILPVDNGFGYATKELEMLKSNGVGAVRLASHYHAGRWYLPQGPRAVLNLRDTSTLAVESLKQGTASLVPPIDEESGAGTFEATARAAKEVGLDTIAWAVGTHNSTLAGKFPYFAHKNAFGETERHALCPRTPEVSDYLIAIVARLSRIENVSAIDLEAFTWFGWAHSGHHEKYGVPNVEALNALLSLCFCAACETEFLDQGLQVTCVRKAVREAVRRLAANPSPQALSPKQVVLEALPEAGAKILELRERFQKNLVLSLIEASQGVPLQLRVTGKELVAGPKASIDLPWLASQGVEPLFSALDNSPATIEGELKAIEVGVPDVKKVTFGLSMLAPELKDRGELDMIHEILHNRGVEQVSYYAHGLALSERWNWLSQER